MKNRSIMKLMVAASFATLLLFSKQTDVKAAAPEFNQATTFMGNQATWLGNTVAASATDGALRGLYTAAQAAQIAQTLNTTFNAALNDANATRQAAVNNWQLQQNYKAYLTNLDAEHRNINTAIMYNYTNTSDRNFANSIAAINNYYAFMMGQSPAPIYTAP